MLLALAIVSCGDDSGGASTTTPGTMTQTSTTAGSSTTDATGDDTSATADASTSSATETGAETTTETTETMETTGSGPNLGVCEDYIECAMEATPETIATVIATYGPEGSCWSLPGVTEEDCWTECAAQMLDQSHAHRSVIACWSCEDDTECPAATPRCDLSEHVCRGASEMEHCEEIAADNRCYEATVESEAPESMGCNGSHGADTCPSGALGYCWDAYGVFATGQVMKLYAPLSIAQAEAECAPFDYVFYPL